MQYQSSLKSEPNQEYRWMSEISVKALEIGSDMCTNGGDILALACLSSKRVKKGKRPHFPHLSFEDQSIIF